MGSLMQHSSRKGEATMLHCYFKLFIRVTDYVDWFTLRLFLWQVECVIHAQLEGVVSGE